MRVLLRVVAGTLGLVLCWYLVADRLTPFTSNARVKAIVSQVVPQVSGTVIKVAAANGEILEPGDVLLQIDPRAFEIEKERAEADLERATRDVGAWQCTDRADRHLVCL